MTELYIVRHGVAVPFGTPGLPDDQRPLTPKGEKRVRQVGRGLRRLGVQPERIVTSPLPRAARTAELLAEALRLAEPPQPADLLGAAASAPAIRAWLEGRHETRLMLVGHNPALSRLVALLVVGDGAPELCDLDKAGVAALTGELAGGMTLAWLATAKLLRRIE